MLYFVLYWHWRGRPSKDSANWLGLLQKVKLVSHICAAWNFREQACHLLWSCPILLSCSVKAKSVCAFLMQYQAGYGAKPSGPRQRKVSSERLDSDWCGTLARAEILGVLKSKKKCLFLMSLGIFCAGAMDKENDLHLTKPNNCCQKLLTSRLLRLFS